LQRALFLDRDGVINIDRHYVHAREDFVFQDGIFELARVAAKAGLLIVIVTNQSGIARGKYSEADFQLLTDWMCGVFASEGAPVARVYHCPCHPDFPDPVLDLAYGTWRKPQPGMLLQASADLGIDLAASVMIGDQWSDAQAAFAAGLKHMIIVGEPKEQQPAGCETAVRAPSVRDAIACLPAKSLEN
jgi:D-glycero-D-manno-heptose 1,7-bisphosphate phosphatase